MVHEHEREREGFGFRSSYREQGEKKEGEGRKGGAIC